MSDKDSSYYVYVELSDDKRLDNKDPLDPRYLWTDHDDTNEVDIMEEGNE